MPSVCASGDRNWPAWWITVLVEPRSSVALKSTAASFEQLVRLRQECHDWHLEFDGTQACSHGGVGKSSSGPHSETYSFDEAPLRGSHCCERRPHTILNCICISRCFIIQLKMFSKHIMFFLKLIMIFYCNKKLQKVTVASESAYL